MNKVLELPHINVGEVSWLKAAVTGDSGEFVPDPISQVSDLVNEEHPVITDDLIDGVEAALYRKNNTSYDVSKPGPIVEFLRQHKGKRAFTVSW
jgi:hypothetical protein